MVRLLSPLIVVVLLVGLSSCCPNTLWAGNSLPVKSEDQKQSDVTVIAVVGPRTGLYSKRFEEILRGVSKALSENASNYPVRVLSFDDACSAKGARAAALKIVASGAVAVFGHPCPSAAHAAHDIYQQSRLICFLLGGPQVRDTDKSALEQSFVFQILREQERSNGLIGRRLVSFARGKRIALVHDKTEYSRNLTHQIEDFIRAASGDVPLIIGIDGAKEDYRIEVAELILADIGAVYFAGFEAEARIFIENLEATQTSVVVVGTETLVTPSFLKFVEKWFAAEISTTDVVGSSNLVTIGLSVPFTSQSFEMLSKSNISDGFRLMYQGAGFEADASRAVQIWLASLVTAGGENSVKIARALSRGQFQTEAGSITFDENGRVELPSTSLVMFRKGRWEPLELED